MGSESGVKGGRGLENHPQAWRKLDDISENLEGHSSHVFPHYSWPTRALDGQGIFLLLLTTYLLKAS